MSREPAAKSGVPGAVARPAAPRKRSAALRRRPRREVSQRRSSASAVIKCCSRASEIDRSRSSSFSRAPTRSAVMRSRTATSSRRKAIPPCCSRTTASRRRISSARAATASSDPLSRRERVGVRGVLQARNSDRVLAQSPYRISQVFSNAIFASLGDDGLAVGLAHDALERGDEFVGRVVERDDVGVRLELRQAARDDRLSRREVLVELDGIGRLGQRRALEGNRADVEAGDVAGQVGVGHFTEEVDVRSPFEALERGALRGADQDEAPVGMLAGRQGDCLGVEPRRDGAVVADDGARVLRERARVAGGKFRESLRVGGVRESQRVRPDLADPLEQRP